MNRGDNTHCKSSAKFASTVRKVQNAFDPHEMLVRPVIVCLMEKCERSHSVGNVKKENMACSFRSTGNFNFTAAGRVPKSQHMSTRRCTEQLNVLCVILLYVKN